MAGSAAAAVSTLLCGALLCFLLTAPPAEAAITCGRLLTHVSSCVGYVQSGGTLPPSCCDALRNLNAATTQTSDLQAACVCLKNVESSFPTVTAHPSTVPSCTVEWRGLPLYIGPWLNDCRDVQISKDQTLFYF